MINNAELITLSQTSPLVSGSGKILIIGAAGQIGEHVKPLLESLYPNKVISVSRTAIPEKNIQAVDITNTAALLTLIKEESVEVVVNLAAFLSAKSEKSPEAAREVNYEAVKRLIEGSKELGVKQIFTPSSIAVYGADAEKHATMQSLTNPSGVYGKAKVDLENFMREWNAKGEGAFTTGMRLGGVLTCKIPPSEGTAMEFDKMLIAAAYKNSKGGIYEPLREYYKDGVYYPKIPADTKLPFILVDDAAKEIVRYIHNVKPTDINATRHHLASFTLNMTEFIDLVKRKAPLFKVGFDKTSQTGARARFSQEWPDSLDMSLCYSWGFDPSHCSDAKAAVDTCFNRITDALRNQVRTR